MKNYPKQHHHIRKMMENLRMHLPETMGAFGALHKASVADGALNTKVKELIALGIGIALRCDGCIAFHTKDALKAGATKEEIIETIGVAILMGGGPSVMYGCEALEALEQFQEVVG